VANSPDISLCQVGEHPDGSDGRGQEQDWEKNFLPGDVSVCHCVQATICVPGSGHTLAIDRWTD
jgi:hypothetical protein